MNVLSVNREMPLVEGGLKCVIGKVYHIAKKRFKCALFTGAVCARTLKQKWLVLSSWLVCSNARLVK